MYVFATMNVKCPIFFLERTPFHISSNVDGTMNVWCYIYEAPHRTLTLQMLVKRGVRSRVVTWVALVKYSLLVSQLRRCTSNRSHGDYDADPLSL